MNRETHSRRRVARPPIRSRSGDWLAPERPALLCFFCVLTFMMGGSARGDVASLMILRPIAVMILSFALWGLTWEQVKAYRHLFILAGCIVVLIVIHLIPLPPDVWIHLPGRKVIADIDRVAGLGEVWRPISMAPTDTFNSLYSLCVPLATLILAVRLPFEQHRKLLMWIVALGAITALVALGQVINPHIKALYFFRITNPGTAVGIFANRNHQAVMLALLFPMLAVLISTTKINGRVDLRAAAPAATLALFLIPLVFVTGSRIGLIDTVVGLLACPFLYRPSQKNGGSRRNNLSSAVTHHRRRVSWLKPRTLAMASIPIAILIVSAVTIELGRAEAFQRIFAGSGDEEFRLRQWPSVIRAAVEYFPVGSGVGSFVPVYKVTEPASLLTSNYFNHAHNDYLEVLLTAGLSGVVLLVYAVVAFVMRALIVLRTRNGDNILLARLGLVLIAMLALASVGDYPLRTPNLMLLFTLAAVWASTPLRTVGRQSRSIDASDRLPHDGPNFRSEAL